MASSVWQESASPQGPSLLIVSMILSFGFSQSVALGQDSADTTGVATPLVVLIALVVSVLILIHVVTVNFKLNQRRKRVSRSLAQMSQLEPDWSESRLENTVRDLFVRVQDAKSCQDLAPIKDRLAPEVLSQWASEIEKQKADGKRIHIEQLEIKSVRFVGAKNYSDNSKDEFTVCIDAKCRQAVVPQYQFEPPKEKSLARDSFREFWTLQRDDRGWRLREVRQHASWSRFLNSEIVYELRSASSPSLSPQTTVRMSQQGCLSETVIMNVSRISIFASGISLALCLFRFAPANVPDAVLKIAILVVPSGALIFWIMLFRLLRILERSDASTRAFFLSLAALAATVFNGLISAVVYVNVSFDHRRPMVVSSEVIQKYETSFPKRGRKYRLVTTQPDLPKCCLLVQDSLRLAVGKAVYDSAVEGQSTIHMEIKQGFFEMPYIKSWYID